MTGSGGGADASWRPIQIDHNRKARERLARGGWNEGAKFWDWEAVMMFHEIVIAIDGYAEIGGMPAPRSHKARRALVKQHLPHLVEPYGDLYGPSLTVRYYKGYAMTKNDRLRAARCHEMLAKSIPVQ